MSHSRRTSLSSLSVLFALATAFSALAVTPVRPAWQPAPAVKARLAANYGKLPLSFEANRGQTDRSVQYLSHGQGYTLFLRPDEAVLTLNSARKTNPRLATQARANTAAPMIPRLHAALLDKAATEKREPASIVRMKLVGANPHPVASELEPQITRTNYFIGNDPKKWHTDIPNYARVKYAGIYPGIDLVYYGNQRQLEHDFIVAPGADPSQIVLHLAGSTPRIDPKTGDLILKTATGELRLNKPVTYQHVDGERRKVASSYKLLAANKVGFRVGAYDHSAHLVIDPVLLYSTYLGGSSDDFATAIAVDPGGDAYVTGQAFSTDFPVLDAYQSTNKNTGNSGTAFVSELKADGSALVYSTYLGGSRSDGGTGIAVDSSGNAYVTGNAGSDDFPTQNPYQSTKKDLSTAFVTKIKAGGSTLVYSTYLGGSFPRDGPGEMPAGIAVDASGHAYVAGLTLSSDFPTVNAYQSSPKSLEAAFVTEFSPDGSSLVYSTYLAGSSSLNGATGIAVDASSNAYVTGFTNSSDFPVVHALQSIFISEGPPGGGGGAGALTAFVTEFKAGGQSLVYSTYLGGTTYEQPDGIAVDGAGDAYVTGVTGSSDFPLVNPVQSTPHSVFVSEIKAGGSPLVYSTYLGGTSGDFGVGIGVDRSGRATIFGSTYSSDFPVLNAIQSHRSGRASAFITQYAPGGGSLVYSTYLGGSRGVIPQLGGIAVDAAGDAFVTGATESRDFPTTVNAFQRQNNGYDGASSAFISKIGPPPDTATQTATPTIAPPAGTYAGPRTIFLQDATAGAKIYYTTTYGATPTTSSTLYTGPFMMASAGSVAAIAATTGHTNSAIVNAYYGLRVAQPSFSGVAGMYNETESVTIADITPGAAIHYTLDGSTPMASSPIYTSPIEVTTPETITAIGMLAGYENSTVNSHSYVQPAAAPVVSPGTSTFYSPQLVTITSATPGAKIYYTTTYGATPTTSSTLYTGPFTVSTSETVAAIAAAPGLANSLVGSSYYGLRVLEPTFDHAGITYSAPITLAIADATPGATIYYTTDGTTPTASSTKYTGPISITTSERIEAIALLPGYEPSSIMNAYFTIH